MTCTKHIWKLSWTNTKSPTVPRSPLGHLNHNSDPPKQTKHRLATLYHIWQIFRCSCHLATMSIWRDFIRLLNTQTCVFQFFTQNIFVSILYKLKKKNKCDKGDLGHQCHMYVHKLSIWLKRWSSHSLWLVVSCILLLVFCCVLLWKKITHCQYSC